jgi:formylglycine-generating enzyme required for sulfatase activity
MKPDRMLFVSHVSEDRSAAIEIVEELERRGVRCWIAPRDVRPGNPFDDEIADAIEASRAMLLIFSERCNESEYIRREVTVAGESQKVIIPFRIENAQPKRGLRVRLSDLHWIDGFVSQERAVDELVRTFQAPMDRTIAAATSDHARGSPASPAAAKADTIKVGPQRPRLRPALLAACLLGAAALAAAGVWFVALRSAPSAQVQAPSALATPQPAANTKAPQASGVPPPANPAPPREAEQPAPPPTEAVADGVAPLSLAREKALEPKDTFKECAECPDMIVLPSGAFTMGSPPTEKYRFDNEGPQHIVTIAKPFAVGQFHVTLEQFAAFALSTGYNARSKCWVFENGKIQNRDDRWWRNPGFPQGPTHPAVCISWGEAKAYVAWLVNRTGKPYRLLTEAEWEYAARGRTEPGTYPRYSFGNDEKDVCRYGNGADLTARDSIPGARSWTILPCNDGYAYTSPVGNFIANDFDLYDMQGDASQWTEDCWHDNYAGAPSDGSAWISGDCSRHAIRGGDWFFFAPDPRFAAIRAARRGAISVDDHASALGLRVARTLAR